MPNPQLQRNDAELIEKIAAGDLGELGVIFDRYEPTVKRFIGYLGVPHPDVDDLVQLTFMDICRAAASFDARYSVRSWLLGLAAMVVRRHRRSAARMASGLLAWAREPRQPSGTPVETYELYESAALANRAIDRLSAKKREVFCMVVLENAKGEEVAQALGIPVATVWTRLHHARNELRAFLAEDAS